MSASLGLFRLQQIDSQIDRAKARLDIIQSTLENDKLLKDALNRFNNASDENSLASHQAKNAETEAHSLKLKIEQTEASLYSGNVRNPKELQDLQLEIASLKKHLVTLEEREMEAMLLTEKTETNKESAKQDLESVQTRVNNEHKNLLDEKMQLVSQLESLTQEREAALAPIENSLLAVYEDLRKHKRGVAIAEVDDDSCASCGTNLNAALQQNARSQNKLAYCPSCGRILFAK